jgi:ubiquinone/menaquinone biosynthesis C-methylase UbiE
MTITEKEIQNFWQNSPCDDGQLGGLDQKFNNDYHRFFDACDDFRNQQEGHILRCLDDIDFQGKRVLEIGLGEGSDSEQIVRRGAIWTGLDLTEESVKRVTKRMEVRGLEYEKIICGSALDIPLPDNSFDIVYSHGVLHHIPNIEQAQSEIARILKPGGELVAMVYARRSLNYLLSICLLRRFGLAALYLLRIRPGGTYSQHIDNMRREGFFGYLKMKNFIHRNTDGPNNPYSKVYNIREVEADFSCFGVVRHHKAFMWAPPIPVNWIPFSHKLGWHLWVHLKARR